MIKESPQTRFVDCNSKEMLGGAMIKESAQTRSMNSNSKGMHGGAVIKEMYVTRIMCAMNLHLFIFSKIHLLQLEVNR